MIMQAFNSRKDLLHRRNYSRRRCGIPDLKLVILISRCLRLSLHRSVEVLVAPEGSAVSGLPIPGKSALCGSDISRLIADPSNPFEAPCGGFVRLWITAGRISGGPRVTLQRGCTYNSLVT